MQVRLGLLEVGGKFGQSPINGFYGQGDPVLLALKQIKRYGTGVVGIKQSLSLVLELAEPSLLCSAFAVSIKPELGQFFAQEGPQVEGLIPSGS